MTCHIISEVGMEVMTLTSSTETGNTTRLREGEREQGRGGAEKEKTNMLTREWNYRDKISNL